MALRSVLSHSSMMTAMPKRRMDPGLQGLVLATSSTQQQRLRENVILYRAFHQETELVGSPQDQLLWKEGTG